jgi:hypothetical protein
MKLFSKCAVTMCVMFGGLTLRQGARAQTVNTPKVKGLPVVYVMDTSGSETKGKLVSWTGSTIVVQTGATMKTFGPGEAARIDLRGDSLKNGALIGAGVGVLFGGLASGLDCPDCGGSRVGIFLFSVGVYAAIGAGIDALIPGRTHLWSAGMSKSASGLTFRLSPERRRAFVGWRTKIG